MKAKFSYILPLRSEHSLSEACNNQYLNRLVSFLGFYQFKFCISSRLHAKALQFTRKLRHVYSNTSRSCQHRPHGPNQYVDVRILVQKAALTDIMGSGENSNNKLMFLTLPILVQKSKVPCF